MHLFDLIAILITITAAFAYLNFSYLRLPTTIGVMVISLVVSIFIILLDLAGLDISSTAERMLLQVDFDETLMHGLLSFLLFAGALHVNLDDLAKRKWIIGSMASISTLLSTFIIGTLIWFVLGCLAYLWAISIVCYSVHLYLLLIPSQYCLSCERPAHQSLLR